MTALDDQSLVDSQDSNVVEGTTVPAVQILCDDQRFPDGGDPTIRGDQAMTVVQPDRVTADPTPRPTRPVPPSTEDASGGAQAGDGQCASDVQASGAVAQVPPGPAIQGPQAIGDSPVLADPDSRRGRAKGEPEPIVRPPVLADPVLAIAADILDDLERVRIANENRYRQLTRHELDSDDEVRGFGLSEDDPAVLAVGKLVAATKVLETDAVKNLERMMRKHALGPWVKGLTGVGEKQAARLLAVVGDPTWHSRDDRPRTVSELRSYCGWGDARAQVRRRGEKANWSDTAKKRTWVIAESCVRIIRDPCKSARPEGQVWVKHGDGCNCSPFRVAYDEARQKYEGSVHDVECRRCGPKGKPAEAGSPRSDGHVHAMCLRVVAKAILKSMWCEGRRLRGDGDE